LGQVVQLEFEFDPKKAYTPEQLAEIGAITLKWNQIEAAH
jgi:hypothetical protein